MPQYILGINGWPQRSHDASACLVKDGEILAMAEEERFIRKKHAYDCVPIHAARWCLDANQITLDDIDIVALGWDYKLLHEKAGLRFDKGDLSKIFFPSKYFQYKKPIRFEFVAHHLAHAASTYFLSGMESASILVIDGQGESESITLAVGNGNDIKILDRYQITESLGYFYDAIGEYIGLGLGASGKTMGLASYGSIINEFNPFELNERGYKANLPTFGRQTGLDRQEEITHTWLSKLEKTYGPKNEFNRILETNNNFIRTVKFEQKHKDIAATAQNALEEIIQHTISILINATGINNLCLAGGVALNCTSNGKISKRTKAKQIFIPPFVEDSGVSAGAALYVCSNKQRSKLHSAYLGPSYSDDELMEILNNLGIRYRIHEHIEQQVAELLAENKIVGWFQGNMEVGPRALGARSILTSPLDKRMHQKVNNTKSREQWRPLSPSIIEERYKEYFDLDHPSPFMLFAANVKPDKVNEIPAVVHVDGSARPQTVSARTNKRYHHLINEFAKITGTPVVLNTSFNNAAEPIVCSPRDALSTFYTTPIDYLALGSCLIKK